MSTLFVFAHTHWDREWYQPFESFRMQLLAVVSEILDDMESGDLPRFCLDGQAVIFDDVLEVEPKLRPRLQAQLRSGNLAAGPWYVLADQMLVGGESLVRNLSYGIKTTAELGPVAMIGYCPDTFGHSQDLPRILNGFGINHAVVWRGVPLLEMGPLFRWSSPDGSRVLAYHLTRGYYQTAFHEMGATGLPAAAATAAAIGAAIGAAAATVRSSAAESPTASPATMVTSATTGSGGANLTALADYVVDWLQGAPSNPAVRPYCSSLDAALMPVGADHAGPVPKFAELIKKLNSKLQKRGANLQVVSTSLGDFLQAVAQSVLGQTSAADKPSGSAKQRQSAMQSGSGKPSQSARQSRPAKQAASVTDSAQVPGPAGSLRGEKAFSVVQSVDGELRFNRCAALYERSYLLYGVLSTRLYLKRANRLSEHGLLSRCEPVFALLTALKVCNYPQAELDHIWKLLLKNQPHDSICGCSVDAVHREMQTRSASIEAALDCQMDRAAQAVAGVEAFASVDCHDPAFASDRLLVFNTSASTVRMPIRIRWWSDLDAAAAGKESVPMQIDSRQKVDKLFSGWGAVPYYKEVMECEGWIWPPKVPGMGLTSLAWSGLKGGAVQLTDHGQIVPSLGGQGTVRSAAAGGADEIAEPAMVSLQGHRLSNGLLDVAVLTSGKIVVSHTVDGKTDTYRINHILRDVGDGGDSYNFDPIPDDKPITARCVQVRSGKGGPLVGSLVITYELELPQQALPAKGIIKRCRQDLGKIEILKRSNQKIKQLITTEILLKRGVPIVFFTSEFDNQAADHRLEVLFDTESQVKTTDSENHFSLVTRHHSRPEQQKLPVPVAHETLPDRFPCQRFFAANGQLFLNVGMPEYGVEGSQVTMTLLRAISWLSRPRLWSRGGGAGPSLSVPEANCFGANKLEYGWAPLPSKDLNIRHAAADQATARAYELAELFAGPTWATWSREGTIDLGSVFSLDNRAIRVAGCFVEGGELILRLLNVTKEPQPANLNVRARLFASATLVELSGAVLAKLSWKKGPIALNFGENQLLTVRFNLR